MKILFLLLLLFINNAYAQGDVYNLLISGETKQLKQAAKLMTKDYQNTPENAFLLARIIEDEFENAPSNRIDALSWGCTALGSTGDGRYKELLNKIYRSNAHVKLRKYANKAYKRLPSTRLIVSETNNETQLKINSAKPSTVINLPIQQNTHELIPKASLTELERKIFAIAKGDWDAIKIIAKQSEEVNSSDTEVLDTLSQFLIEMYPYDLDGKQIDTLAWICRKLGSSKNGRYKHVLQQVYNNATDKKLRNYAKSASEALTYSSSKYVIGSINFHEIIDKFKA